MKYVLVEKSGECVGKTSKNGLSVNELYKKCGFKKIDGFIQVARWELADGLEVAVYGRVDGKAGSENKFEYPQPIDKQLFYGNMAIVAFMNGENVDLDVDHWGEIYSELMGGFEDIKSVDSEEDEEHVEEEEDVRFAGVVSHEDEEEEYTVDGYVKDDFVVEDEEEDDPSEEELMKEEYVTESDGETD